MELQLESSQGSEMDLYNNFASKKLARDEITMTSKEKFLLALKEKILDVLLFE